MNSALHPTRLDVDHIAGEVEQLLSDVETTYGVDRHEAAKKTVFVSHETYTPARGGSADAEIASLRRAFGEHADDVVIANTKGFTGHAMGAGIEDVRHQVRCNVVGCRGYRKLQKSRIPTLAPCVWSRMTPDYALRLAAGFGSQLAVAFMRFRARTEDRVTQPGRVCGVACA
ncbi:MAG: hypothetical protein R3E66_22925 [bacterium]